MVVPRSILAPFMAVLIEEIGYGGNFKATLPSSNRNDSWHIYSNMALRAMMKSVNRQLDYLK